MDYIERTQAKDLTLPNDLWYHVEHISEDNIEILLSSLEISVSNGWVNVAAEISEQLEATNYLDKRAEWRIRLEIERMKRIYNIGYLDATRACIDRVMKYIHLSEKELETNELLLWKSTAIGHLGWLVDDPDELDGVVQECELIQARFQPNSKLAIERKCFLYALHGKRALLANKIDDFHECFRNAISLSSDNKFARSLAHLTVLYAEHLAEVGDLAGSTQLVHNFVDQSSQYQIKTFLYLRALILLSNSPEECISDRALRYYETQYFLLISALGLSDSQTLYPILKRRVKRFRSHSTPDVPLLQSRTHIISLLAELNWKHVEKIIAAYYESIGCEVITLGENFPAFDLIAVYRIPDGTVHRIAIQVKAWSHGMVKKRDVPDDEVLRLAVDLLKRDHHIDSISTVRWYIFSGIERYAATLLTERIKTYFECPVECTVGVGELVDMLLERPELIVRLIIGEWSGPVK